MREVNPKDNVVYERPLRLNCICLLIIMQFQKGNTIWSRNASETWTNRLFDRKNDYWRFLCILLWIWYYFCYKFGVICNVFHATNYNCFKRAIYCVSYSALFGTDCLHRLTRDNLVQRGTKNAINLSKEFSSGFFPTFSNFNSPKYIEL